VSAEDHIGYLIKWASRAARNGYYPLWDYEEILSEAYLRAHHLLTNKYDPKRGAPTTFLSVCLRTDLTHVYQRQFGNYIRWEPKPSGQGRRVRWVPKIPIAHGEEAQDVGGPEQSVEVTVEELNLEGREKYIVEKISEGWSYLEIAESLGISRSRVGQILRNDIVDKIRPMLEREP
jgi:DNA-directed RNA polymerase specialized sigma24 family protein